MNEHEPDQPTPNPPTATQSVSVKKIALWLTVGAACLVLGVLVSGPVKRGVAKLAPDAEADSADVTRSAVSESGTSGGGGGVTLYQSGMHPWIITTEPGNCPICGMKLEPIDPSKLTGEVTIDPVVVQNLGVRTAEVVEGPLMQTVRTVGTVEVAEPRVRDVNLRVSGWIESLNVDFVGARVRRDDPLFELYSPELYAAQEELLLARQRSDGGSVLAQSARDRLLNFGLTEKQIDQIVEAGQAKRTVPILSPHDGTVLDKHANDGMRVDPGMRVFRIGDLSEVWVQVTMYEYQLPYVEVGLPATMTLPSLPNQTYEGQVVFIDPTVDRQTRTVQVRLSFENPDGRLKPGMFADVTLRNTLAGSATLAPREAVIDTGQRSVAFVSLGQGRFEPRDVTVGVDADGGMVQVTSGLIPGERVVTSGQFLLDSEASVRESLARMVRGEPAAEQKPQVTTSAGASATLPPAVQQQIDTLAGSYLGIQDRLTRDTLDGVAAQLAKLREAAMHLGHLADDDLRPLADRIHKASDFAIEDLDVVREAFGPLSDETIALLTKAPPSSAARSDAAIYVTHCPMVNKNWLQLGEEVRNPYASYMLNCGNLETRLGTAASGDPDAMEGDDAR